MEPREELLNEWRMLVDRIAAECRPLQEQEMELRKQVFAAYFVDPKEGTNYAELGNGWRLKGVYKLDRKVDEAALPAVQETLRNLGINPDILVEWKPSLKSATYKELTKEQQETFDQALITKPGSPSMELVAPKEKKNA